MGENKSNGVAAVVSEDFGYGFSLAGVTVLPAHDAAQAMEILKNELRLGRFGLLIVDEALLERVDERERAALFQRPVPLIIAIPGAMKWSDVEAATSDEFVTSLIRRAVGYQLNIQV